MEVAYMRISLKGDCTIQDCHDLQKSLPNANLGDTPSSSGSDDGSLYNRGTLANVTPSKSHDSGGTENRIATGQDQQELQKSLPNTPQGGTPLSSDSEGDSLLNQAMLANVTPSNEEGHIIVAAENVPKYQRMLNLVRDVSMAMDARRKCLEAVAAAKVDIGESEYAEAFLLVEDAVNVCAIYADEVIRRAQLAMHALKSDY